MGHTMKWVAVLVLALALPASAGTSYVYLVGASAEYGPSSPCTRLTTAGAPPNDQPYTPLTQCDIGQTVYYKMFMPADYSPANTVGNFFIGVEYMPVQDNASNHYVCWQASVTVWPIGSYTPQNYLTTSLGTLASGTILADASKGTFNPISTILRLTNAYDAHTQTYCAGTTCTNSVATLKLQRVACTGVGQTDLTGPVGVLGAFVSYRN